MELEAYTLSHIGIAYEIAAFSNVLKCCFLAFQDNIEAMWWAHHTLQPAARAGNG
jgi:hypothetical protein